MELKEAIGSRRSVRKFLSKPVSEEVIRELIAGSLWAPSWGNTQPWEIVVVTGEKLAEFKKLNQEALLAGKETKTDIPMPNIWPEDKTIVMGAILGWPDSEAAVNQFERQRGAMDEFVKWVR